MRFAFRLIGWNCKSHTTWAPMRPCNKTPKNKPRGEQQILTYSAEFKSLPRRRAFNLFCKKMSRLLVNDNKTIGMLLHDAGGETFRRRAFHGLPNDGGFFASVGH